MYFNAYNHRLFIEGAWRKDESHMIDIYMPDPRGELTPCCCDNCGEVTLARDLLPVQGAELDAGAEVPAGRCPVEDCGALCYIIKEEI